MCIARAYKNAYCIIYVCVHACHFILYFVFFRKEKVVILSPSTLDMLITVYMNEITKKCIHDFRSDAHHVKVCHGDIKCENTLVTTWLWVYVTDFASYKPVLVPEVGADAYIYIYIYICMCVCVYSCLSLLVHVYICA